MCTLFHIQVVYKKAKQNSEKSYLFPLVVFISIARQMIIANLLTEQYKNTKRGHTCLKNSNEKRMDMWCPKTWPQIQGKTFIVSQQ